MKIARFIFILLIIGSPILSQDIPVKNSSIKTALIKLENKLKKYDDTDSRPKIGIALAGGAALGFSHLGVLEMIDSLNIPVDFVAGTSMGGIVGGLYSIGYDVDELRTIAINTNWNDVFTDMPSRDLMPYFEKKNTGRYQLEFALDGITPVIPSGLIMGQKVSLTFSSLTYGYENFKSFDDLPIPFRCVAVDLVTGKEVILSKGSLSKAMRATMSIPSVFSPVVYGDSLLIDGGVLNNFPVNIVKDMGADIIIGLNLVYPQKTKEDYNSLFEVLDRTTEIPRSSILNANINSCDIYIEQYTGGLSLMDFDSVKIPEIIQRGTDAANLNKEYFLMLEKYLQKWSSRRLKYVGDKKKISGIVIKGNKTLDLDVIKNDLNLAENQLFDEQVLKQRISQLIDRKVYKKVDYACTEISDGDLKIELKIEEYKLPLIYSVDIRGNKELEFAFVYSNLGIKPGDKFNTSTIENKINSLYSLGYFEIITYEIGGLKDGAVELIINVKEKPTRTGFVGFRYNDFHQLVGAIGIQATSLFFSGLRVEAELQFAGLSQIFTKIYYPSRSMDIPIYPFLSGLYKNIPISAYDERGKKFAQYKDRAWKFSAGIGFPLSKYGIFETSYGVEWMNISADIASETSDIVFPTWRDNLHLIQFSLDFDLLDDALIPTRGMRIQAETEISSKRLGSDLGYARTSISGDWYGTLGGDHTMMIGGAFMLQWRDTPQYKWFNIGGPQSFVGYDYYQTNGSRFLIAKMEYRYAFKKDIFIKILGNVGFDYNLGTPSQQKVGKPLSGAGIGLMFDSILGPVEFIAALGDKSSYNPGKMRVIYYFNAGYKF